ncbi:3'-5' exonuclease [Clostridium sp. P21]|uniref:3'-5' exonuclease n=1 Tax=Clostridium muellerianum TaxID=2716538 RepID=A0A7Y0HLG3_9CLOT|nr:3'-5' exonuclease [Clostridium muellerianum]NMM61200.1 3'-5' exonuclease [Clostridium muellerianum]
MGKQYTEKQLKGFTIVNKVLFIILGIMLLLLTIVFPICLLFSIGAFIIAFKYKAKNASIGKTESHTLYEPIKASDDYYSQTYSKGIESYSQTYNCTEIPPSFVILDLETTGLSSLSDKIIEISIIKYENGRVVDTYNQLIDPEMHIPQEASNINGITNDMVKGCPKIHEIIDNVYDRINGEIVMGYNVEFDIKFLSTAFGRSNKKIDKLVLIDVLQVVKETLPSKETQNRKLETMKNYFGIESTSHRALADCEVTFEVFKRCLKIKKNYELQRQSEQKERVSKLNDGEKLFISALEEKLYNINLKDKLRYNIMSDKVINFQINNAQIGRVKLNGRKYKMQILDKDNVLWLDIDNVDEAVNNIKHWIKYCEYLTK